MSVPNFHSTSSQEQRQQRRSSSSLYEQTRFPLSRPPPPPPALESHAPSHILPSSFDLPQASMIHPDSIVFPSTAAFSIPTASLPALSFPSVQRTQQQAADTSDHRHPVATHQDNWLDRTATTHRDDDPFGYFPDFLFDGFFNEHELSPPSENQPTPHSSGDVYPFAAFDESNRQHGANPAMPTQQQQQQQQQQQHHSHHRRSTQPNIVDLTGASTSPPDLTTRRAENRKRSAEPAASSSSMAAGPASKRGRIAPEKVEEVDLTHEALSAEEKLRQAQQQEAIRSQQAAEEGKGPQRIGRRQCIICMENYTDATTTICGHFYCHECLIQALMAGEKNSDRNVGSCPVCRKSINRKKQHQVIPISFMKRATFEKSYRQNRSLIG